MPSRAEAVLEDELGSEGSSSSEGSRTGACPRSQLWVSCQGWPWQLCGLCSAAALWPHQVPQPWEPQEDCRIREGLLATPQGWSCPTDTCLGFGPAYALEKKPLRQVLRQCPGQGGLCRWGHFLPLVPLNAPLLFPVVIIPHRLLFPQLLPH